MALAIFCIVYAGMFLGNVPGLAIDRTGIALLAAIVLIVFGGFTSADLINAIDWTTMAMLFGLMIVSAQCYFSGFYALIARQLSWSHTSPRVFLLLVILIAGLLSAVLINDIVCLAFTPVLIQICRYKGWKPLPFLLGLAAASNLGSTITLIGNPQNILISETLNLSFTGYFIDAALPSILGLFWIWAVLCFQTKGHWTDRHSSKSVLNTPIDVYQIIKGLIVIAALVVFFFATSIPRYQITLIAAGLLLLSRKMTSNTMLGFIDWQLLVLFLGLFLTNAAFLQSGLSSSATAWIGNHTTSPLSLYGISLVLSNIVSNVPAVMLLLPFTHSPLAGTVLAISSTLAGNLLLIGSVANLIVASKAKEEGIAIHWSAHLKAGLPITIGTVGLSLLWLLTRGL